MVSYDQATHNREPDNDLKSEATQTERLPNAIGAHDALMTLEDAIEQLEVLEIKLEDFACIACDGAERHGVNCPNCGEPAEPLKETP